MTSPVLTSAQNPRVKAVVQLHQAKYREEQSLVLIEGYHAIEEAVKANISLKTIFCLEGKASEIVLPISPEFVSESVMAKMSTTTSACPILAVAESPTVDSKQIFALQSKLIVGVIGLQDPGNLGTLIRSAAAFGASALVTIGPTVDPFHPKVIRSSAGIVFRLAVAQLDNISKLRQAVSAHQELQIWGTDAHQGLSYRQATYADNVLLLMGGEAEGLPPEIWEIAHPLNIPMVQEVESLNVGIAGSIVLAEIFNRSQRIE